VEVLIGASAALACARSAQGLLEAGHCRHKQRGLTLHARTHEGSGQAAYDTRISRPEGGDQTSRFVALTLALAANRVTARTSLADAWRGGPPAK
jgi:hypothetical protein